MLNAHADVERLSLHEFRMCAAWIVDLTTLNEPHRQAKHAKYKGICMQGIYNTSLTIQPTYQIPGFNVVATLLTLMSKHHQHCTARALHSQSISTHQLFLAYSQVRVSVIRIRTIPLQIFKLCSPPSIWSSVSSQFSTLPSWSCNALSTVLWLISPLLALYWNSTFPTVSARPLRWFANPSICKSALIGCPFSRTMPPPRTVHLISFPFLSLEPSSDLEASGTVPSTTGGTSPVARQPFPW